jgi:hypothetical protein
MEWTPTIESRTKEDAVEARAGELNSKGVFGLSDWNRILGNQTYLARLIEILLDKDSGLIEFLEKDESGYLTEEEFNDMIRNVRKLFYNAGVNSDCNLHPTFESGLTADSTKVPNYVTINLIEQYLHTVKLALDALRICGEPICSENQIDIL